MSERYCIEEPALHELPERITSLIVNFLHHREQLRGQRGIQKVELESIALTYRIVVDDTHDLIRHSNEEDIDLEPSGPVSAEGWESPPGEKQP